ncbi:Holliday junction branch migration protein RuvA [Anaeromyxobacter paludicola]|uniref:Holliday junction branch migration complex subunit RuvA n=1 Tax=Anaeromyxobacter paludicola TaxID=2918171 RepID=A0ABM7X9A6_9BACT|nr:Holliday junction branch migration protein RuvA [Anaeromyxobacter paludicola]BDG08412.1 Holliday junction ATP-dependent DNA helicase RuvA [Anaeromyxobacter paludicola]
MIAQLTGTVLEKGDGFAVVDVNGVGYRVFLSDLALQALAPRGERATVRTFTHVSQDAIHLIGFAGEDEERVFHALVEVKGVGPRAALKILSGIAPRDLALAVSRGEVAKLTKVPGVGKKTAERLVVELKDKLQPLARAEAPGRPEKAAGGGAIEQLSQALLGLGYRPQQAEQAADALRDRAEGRPLDELLREALKLLRG